MSYTIEYTETLETTRCWCGIALAIPSNLLRHAYKDGQSVYCPLGHVFSWTETEADKLRKQLQREREHAASLTSRLDQEQASHSATKGQLTKAKKRITNGVCPECNRTFANVARHMKSKHAACIVAPNAAS